MQINRVGNARRNIVSGMGLKLYSILMPFVMRTAIIYVMGSEYLGLDSLFASVLQVLNLSELGIGMAMVNSMYKPIAEDDTETLCALLKMYRMYYRIIGLVVLIGGLIIMPWIPSLISGDVPGGLNIYILYLLNLFTTALSYWLFAYKNSLLNAHQRNDVISKVTIASNTFKYVFQIIAIIRFHNYYIYLIVNLLSQILTNIISAICAIKMYPYYKPKGLIDGSKRKEINQKIRDVFTAKVGGVVVNSADSIVISAFLGLTVLATYQNYYYLITAVVSVLNIITSSCTAGIGNSLVVETSEKNNNDFIKITYLFFALLNFCTPCFLCLFQPFVLVWLGEEYLLSMTMVVLFCIYFVCYETMNLLNLYKDASGMWHQDRFRPLFEAIINLTLNIILVQQFGLVGILSSTIISMAFFSVPWLILNLFKYVFKSEKRSFLKAIAKLVFVVLCSCIISYAVCALFAVSGVVKVIINLMVCCIVPNVLFLVVFRKNKQFRDAFSLLNRAANGKLSFLSRRIFQE